MNSQEYIRLEIPGESASYRTESIKGVKRKKGKKKMENGKFWLS